MRVSATFEKHFAAPNPDKLYHYTTQAGLLGIVQNVEIHATKVQYLNDATEFSLGLELAKEVLRERQKIVTDSSLLTRIEGILNNVDNVAKVNVYVACFCRKGDLLSQWRGYSSNGIGYALGFRTDRLIEAAGKTGFALAQCIYVREDQIRILNELLDIALEIPAPRCIEYFQSGLISMSAYFKDNGFIEEDEWRLVSLPINSLDSGTTFRQGVSMVVPYFKMPLGKHVTPLMADITVGPCPHPIWSQRSVELLMTRDMFRLTVDAKEGPVVVNPSKIPFRNW